MSIKKEDNGSKESKEPDCENGDDKDQLEEKQEEKTRKAETTNQVF